MGFAPKKGWTNDPNGLIVIDNEYHLFFQHYPDDIVWGPMHWGHAVSKDGINWEEKQIAIYPDENGYIFSGSAVLDTNNVSGFGNEDKAVLLCFYTQHNPDTGEQQQCIAYSTDYLNFEKYDGNPVITNRATDTGYKKDFRDPKVFINSVIGGYSMVLAAGERLEFYHSVNLLEWEYTGYFDVAGYLGTGICECPDCFYIDGKWVLSLSYIPTSIAEADVKDFKDRHTMNYFIGEFDGKAFAADEGEDGSKLLDYGPDNYAMVSFANTKEVLMMGWAENWDYVYDIPSQISRGKMTSIRKMSLIDTPAGKMLSQSFLLKSDTYTIPEGETLSIGVLDNSKLTVTVMKDEIIICREPITGTEKSRWLTLEGYNRFRAPRIINGECNVFVIRNKASFEILADDGLIGFTVNV